MKDSHSFDLGSNPNRSIDLPVSFFILLCSYFIFGESFWSSPASPDMSTFTLRLRRKPFGRNLLKRQGCHFTKLIIEIVDNALHTMLNSNREENSAKKSQLSEKRSRSLGTNSTSRLSSSTSMKLNSSVIALQLSWATTSKAKESTTKSWLKCRGMGRAGYGQEPSRA